MIPIDETTAKWIRVLRVDLGCSWGRIGELYKAVTGDTFDGGIQQSGARLCEWSASLLGEKCGEEPWN